MVKMTKTLRRLKHVPEAAARAADLVYVNDESPGIRRRKFGRGFAYYDPVGKKLPKGDFTARIDKLAIPPAYRDVWICPLPNGHLQATGLDDRDRKQYRYHERWHEVRDLAKYAHMVEFARTLPRIRRAVTRDLKLDGLPRERVLAAVVRLMDRTHLRIGNDAYAKDNGHFGLTTLLDDHVDFGRGGRMAFNFVGKSGKERDVTLADPQLAKIVKGCQDLPGQELFAYEDNAAEGGWRDVTSTDVNEYLKEISGHEGGGGFTAKDFRTWAGTVLAAAGLRDAGPAEGKTAIKKQITQVVKATAAELGNTPAVCRKCYIHPAVLDAYASGEVITPATKRPRGLRADEADTLALLT